MTVAVIRDEGRCPQCPESATPGRAQGATRHLRFGQPCGAALHPRPRASTSSLTRDGGGAAPTRSVIPEEHVGDSQGQRSRLQWATAAPVCISRPRVLPVLLSPTPASVLCPPPPTPPTFPGPQTATQTLPRRHPTRSLLCCSARPANTASMDSPHLPLQLSLTLRRGPQLHTK